MFRRLLLLFWTALAGGMALVGAAPLSAQTVLLVVRESVDGKPLPPPLAAKEGLGSGLFDAGFIVVDFPDSARAPEPAEVTQTARTAGADLILTVSVVYTESAIGSSLVRRSAHAAYTLTDMDSGRVRTRGVQDASNKDRETDVDRRALGKELGARVAKRITDALSSVVLPADGLACASFLRFRYY